MQPQCSPSRCFESFYSVLRQLCLRVCLSDHKALSNPRTVAEVGGTHFVVSTDARVGPVVCPVSTSVALPRSSVKTDQNTQEDWITVHPETKHVPRDHVLSRQGAPLPVFPTFNRGLNQGFQSYSKAPTFDCEEGFLIFRAGRPGLTFLEHLFLSVS